MIQLLSLLPIDTYALYNVQLYLYSILDNRWVFAMSHNVYLIPIVLYFELINDKIYTLCDESCVRYVLPKYLNHR